MRKDVEKLEEAEMKKEFAEMEEEIQSKRWMDIVPKVLNYTLGFGLGIADGLGNQMNAGTESILLAAPTVLSTGIGYMNARFVHEIIRGMINNDETRSTLREGLGKIAGNAAEGNRFVREMRQYVKQDHSSYRVAFILGGRAALRTAAGYGAGRLVGYAVRNAFS
jgi:hypothetical protein